MNGGGVVISGEALWAWNPNIALSYTLFTS